MAEVALNTVASTKQADVIVNDVGNSLEGELVPAGTRINPSHWVKGQSGNPSGRRPNSRNKLSDKFLRTMLKVFKEHGLKAVTHVAINDPATYMRSLVAILPKDFQLNLLDHEGQRWVISAAPELTQEQWEAKYNPSLPHEDEQARVSSDKES